MVRTLILVADRALSTALLAALEHQAPLPAVDADDPAAVATVLHSNGWDVCVADARFAAEAAAARRGRGLVVLRANSPLFEAHEDSGRVRDVLLLRIPCSVTTLRDAVQLVADASRLSEVKAS